MNTSNIIQFPGVTTVFIPSERMRNLLKTWLDSTNTVEVMRCQAMKEAV
jgi:hypothetical protein